MISISFVLPLYNKFNTINRAISSIINQSGFDIYNPEIIVVDDGSTDGSVSNINSKYLPFINLYSIPNSGVSVARNFGFNKSNGDYIFFLDSDDELLAGCLELVVNFMERNNNIDFFSGEIELCNEFGKIALNKFVRNKILSENFFLNFLVNPFLLTSSSAIYKRSFFKESLGYPSGYVRGEDVYLWLLMGIKGNFKSIDKPISRIYRNSDNRSAVVNITNYQLPYFILYFLKNQEGIRLFKSNFSLRVLFYWLAFKNMLGFKEIGVIKIVRNLRLEIFKCTPLVGVIFYILSLIPVGLISRLRSLRN
jgi:glycosyltransferase involved in cell wall biosynthesis